jgi:uncharacterized membrane protein YcaP (DUF421 family)
MEMSLTNAVCQIFTIALCHYVLAWLRHRYAGAARILDGSPLILLQNGEWRTRTLSHMHIQDDDVMDAARGEGIRDFSEIDTVILEPVGSISIIPRKPKQPDQTECAK